MTHRHRTTLGLGSTLNHGCILLWEQSTVFHSLADRWVVHVDVDGVRLEIREGKMMMMKKKDQ